VAVIRPGRRALAAAVTAVALLGLPLTAPAAQGAPAAPDCPTTTLDQDIRRADVVFRGEVKKVRSARTTGAQRTRTYKVLSDRVYKSSLVQPLVVVTARVGTRCALPTLTEGTRYIFFVTERGSELMAKPGTAEATPRLTRQVVQRLGTGAQPEPPPPASAEFTTVANADPPALSRLLAPGAALLIISLLGLLVVGRLGRRPSV
jgi:hypothetical protein